MTSITVIDRETGLKKGSIVGSAGLLTAACATVMALRGDRSPRIELISATTGRYIVMDAAGEELGAYDAAGMAAAGPSAPSIDQATPKQIAYLSRLVSAPPYELRNYAAHIGQMLRDGKLSKGEVSMAISRLTWSE